MFWMSEVNLVFVQDMMRMEANFIDNVCHRYFNDYFCGLTPYWILQMLIVMDKIRKNFNLNCYVAQIPPKNPQQIPVYP